MAHETLTLVRTARQAEALRTLAAMDELPPVVHTCEVLVKHLHHGYRPEPRQRTLHPDDH